MRYAVNGLMALALAWGSNISSSQPLCEGFLPPNELKIPVNAKLAGGINEQQFNQVMDKIERLYRDEIASLGSELVVERRWTDETVNAYAHEDDGKMHIVMFGGLARHPRTTPEAMALVACHEIGHHIGGAPKITYMMWNLWATNEGGADYYATLKCLRRYFADEDNARAIAANPPNPVAAATCAQQFPNELDRQICERSSQASQAIAFLFMDLSKGTVEPKFDTPDTSYVQKTYDGHPAYQCRLDTYYSGLGCSTAIADGLDNSDYQKGSCYAPRDSFGARPRCWFAPPAR